MTAALHNEHLVGSPLELVGHSRHLDPVTVTAKPVENPRQERHWGTGPLDDKRKHAHLPRNSRQLEQRLQMPLLIESVGPGEQQVRTQREVKGTVCEGKSQTSGSS